MSMVGVCTLNPKPEDYSGLPNACNLQAWTEKSARGTPVLHVILHCPQQGLDQNSDSLGFRAIIRNIP